MPDLFDQLNNDAFFAEFVTEHFKTAPAEITAVMSCVNTVDPAHVAYAHREYLQNVDKFAVLLHSSNPDQYKRSGALLHALYQSEIVTAVDLESSAEELKAGYTRVHVGDAEHVLGFVEFYEEYYNQALSFGLAYQCCAAYEDAHQGFDFDYLHNVCRYLKENPSLNVDTCFMLYKSLML